MPHSIPAFLQFTRLLLAILIFNVSHSAVYAQRGSIDIVAPTNNEQLSTLPVDVIIVFNENIDPASFSASLNKLDVTDRFTVFATEASASLGLDDGINLSRDNSIKNDKSKKHHNADFVKNKLKITVRNTNGKQLKAKRKFFVAADAEEPAVVVNIESPLDGVEVTDRLIEVRGTITGFEPTFTVTANSFPATVDALGQFSVRYALLEGVNAIAVTVRNGQTLVASQQINVTFTLPAESGVIIDPQLGGVVTITDPQSPLFGAVMEIPPGAARSSFRASISYEPEHFPNLPFGNRAVGPPVVFNPIGETFNSPILLTLPVDPALFDGASIDDVIVLANGDNGYEELPIISRTPNSVTFELLEIFFSPFVAALPVALQPGQLRIESDPAFATIYLDGTNTGRRTPANLSGVTAGQHDIKLFLPTFNELFIPVQVEPGGTTVSDILTPIATPVPEILLDTPIQDGLHVTESVLPLIGAVLDEGLPLPNSVLVLSLNGQDTLEMTDSQGRFNSAVVLLPGQNTLELRANGANLNTGILGPFTITLGSPDISIRLNWNTNTTDLDLHVFDPSGNHAFYGNLGAIPGGNIDRDDVDGFGPEVFTLTNPPPGTYRVAVDAYRLTDPDTGTLVPSTGQLSVVLGTTQIFAGSYAFTAEDFNATNGTGSSTAAFWDAFSFEVGDLIISNVATQTPSPPADAIFTTATGENEITVDIQAPTIVPDGDITLSVRETVENFTVNTTSLTGRQIIFTAEHQPLAGLVNPRNSHPLHYELIASAPTATDSAPATLTQEIRSQIRQEYIDKRDFDSSFIRATPTRAQIIDASQYPGATFFTFNEFARWSDFSPGLAVIDASLNIADQLRTAWGNPVRITSGYRNPRRNDDPTVGGVLNSRHQSGNGVDFNPSYNSANWPVSVLCDPANPATQIIITSYAQAQQALTCIGERLFPWPAYFTDFHANHLHIQRN